MDIIVYHIKNNAGYVPHWLPPGRRVNQFMVPSES